MRRRWIAAGLLLALGACSDSPGDAGAIESGKTVYANVCLVCHSADPRERGTLGPPVADASFELLEAKVLRGKYPPGYTPKQEGQVMPRFEYLEPKLADVAAYLAAVASGAREP